MMTEAYALFGQRLVRNAAQRRIPLAATLEITHRCPLRCRHCANRLSLDDQAARANELQAGEIDRIVGELADLGCLWLLLTGGEPLARPDFRDIYVGAKRRGLLIVLFTNGVLLDDRIADMLAEYPPFEVEISLYGHTPETSARVTGVADARRRSLAGIQRLRERAVPVSLKTVALAENHLEVAAMQSETERLGMRFRFDGLLTPRIDCSTDNLASRLVPDKVVALDLADGRRLAAIKELLDHAVLPPADAPPSLYRCAAGLTHCSVDPYGRLFVCSQSREVAWDLRQGSVRAGWEGAIARERAKLAQEHGRCARCALRPLCGMCPAHATLEQGHPERPVEFMCEVTHLRALAAGVSIAPHGDCPYCGPRRNELAQRVRSVASFPAPEVGATHE
jgi:radical SAM protein with 4Fe4S-binding SPASM domain